MALDRNEPDRADGAAGAVAARSEAADPEQAARIANEAWRDMNWGMFVWLVLMTGARRGELCALSWDRLDFGSGVLTIRSSIAQTGAGRGS